MEVEQSLSPYSRKRKEREEKIEQNVASMLFVEVLFWKSALAADRLKTGYDWRVSILILAQLAKLRQSEALASSM